MRMHHDRPLPSPGPTRIIEFIKRLSSVNLIELSRLLAKEHIAIEGLSNLRKRRTDLWYGIDEEDIEDEL